MSNYTISRIQRGQWIEIAELIAKAIPNALVSKLGNRFGAAYYSRMVKQDSSCGYVATNESNNILGVIIGTTCSAKVRSLALKGQLPKLIIAANFRLLSWPVISWVVKGIIARLKGVKKHVQSGTRDAELIAIAVCQEARGTGVAQELVDKMEKFMVSKKPGIQYVILTEKANKSGNRFYEKIGATFIRTDLHHGKEINQWHKKILAAEQDD